MAKIDLPYEVTNLSPANAVPVQSNFARIEDHVNAELIERGGTVAMAAQLRLAGNPVNALDAAPKQYVDTIIPIGGVIMFTGTAAPAGGVWLVCDGSPVATATYPDLFAVMGTRFGGSGGFFNLPPLTDRFPVGAGPTIAVGVQGGSKDAALVAHTHTMPHDHGGGSTNSVNTDHLHTVTDHLHHPPSVSVAAHNHGPRGAGWLTYTPGSSGQYVPFAASGLEFNTPGSTDDAAVSVTLGMTGVSDRPLGTSFQDRTAAHAHTATVPAFNGSTQTAGTAATNNNMPPYVGIVFIVRAS